MHPARRFFSIGVLAAASSAHSARADVRPAAPQVGADADRSSEGSSGRRSWGMTMDLGVPDGAALGVVVRPRFDWLRVGAAVTHNGMAPGARIGVTIDPVSFPMAPTLTVECGHSFEGRLSIVGGAPTVSYNYANFHVGLEVGNRAAFRFFLRGGASFLDASAAHMQGATGAGSGFGDPSYNGWLAPSGKLGFSAYF